MRGSRPFFTVVIPVRDGGSAFEQCLDALRRSRFRDWELLVVDDGSEDGSRAVADQFGARVILNERGCGPAAARNVGALEARGEYLFFLDADCVVEAGTLGRAAQILQQDRSLAALFGSYDDSPGNRRFLSQYRNLLHHFVHQRGREAASTFWAGCGAVSREAFHSVGGFDEERYVRPSVEDVELGYRLREAGYRIRLAKDVRVKHQKAWTLPTMVATDVLRRGAPWTELLLEKRWMPDVLNLRGRERAAVGLAVVTATASALGLVDLRVLALAGASAGALVILELPLLRFFRRRRGLLFALGAIPAHGLYLLCCALGLAVGTCRFFGRRLVTT